MSGTVYLRKLDTRVVHGLVVRNKLLPCRGKLSAMVAVGREVLNKPAFSSEPILSTNKYVSSLPDAICDSLVEVVGCKYEEFDALDGQSTRGQREGREEQAERQFREHVCGESHPAPCLRRDFIVSRK